MSGQTEQQVADSAAAASAGIAGLTWVAPLNEILQLGVTAIAIVAGIYAIAWHRVRIQEVKRKMRERDEKQSD